MRFYRITTTNSVPSTSAKRTARARARDLRTTVRTGLIISCFKQEIINNTYGMPYYPLHAAAFKEECEVSQSVVRAKYYLGIQKLLFSI